MKALLLFILIMVSGFSISQVGINTENPLASLDINGNLRVRDIQKHISMLPIDSILISDGKGYIEHISQTELNPTNCYSYASGSGIGGLLTISLSGTSWTKIPFNLELIDEHNDFDSSTATFTAREEGIYQVYVQIQTTSLLGADIFGVGIFVEKPGNPPQLVAEESYLNVSVLGISVSPSTRKTQTILKLDAGDTIYFAAKANLISLQLLAGTSSYFTIHQIK